MEAKQRMISVKETKNGEEASWGLDVTGDFETLEAVQILLEATKSIVVLIRQKAAEKKLNESIENQLGNG